MIYDKMYSKDRGSPPFFSFIYQRLPLNFT